MSPSTLHSCLPRTLPSLSAWRNQSLAAICRYTPCLSPNFKAPAPAPFNVLGILCPIFMVLTLPLGSLCGPFPGLDVPPGLGQFPVPSTSSSWITTASKLHKGRDSVCLVQGFCPRAKHSAWHRPSTHQPCAKWSFPLRSSTPHPEGIPFLPMSSLYLNAEPPVFMVSVPLVPNPLPRVTPTEVHCSPTDSSLRVVKHTA